MILIEQIKKQLKGLPPEKQSEVLDFVIFLHQRIQSAPPVAEEERGHRIRAAFQTLAELNAFADINDPVEWQRQIRQDRHLPGRVE
jgi:hypothetical protein